MIPPEKPLAIVCADIHLMLNPPPCRSLEPDWFEAMARPLRALRELSLKLDCPILCSGDVFDRWNAPPQLINFALKELPSMYVIAGQHDLPYHVGNDIEKSALGTLIAAGHVTLVPPEGLWISTRGKQGFYCCGFSWNQEVQKIDERPMDKIHIALHHAYRYTTKNNSYKDAPDSGFMNAKEYVGYDFVVTGDNHISWEAFTDRQVFYNPGSFIRIRADQEEHRPRLGVIYANQVKTVFLDISKEKFNQQGISVERQLVWSSMEEFLEKLSELKSTTIDFFGSMNEYMETHELSEEAKHKLREAIEHARQQV